MPDEIGEIRMFAFDFAPEGWALCDGRLLKISDYERLSKALGTTYDDGKTMLGAARPAASTFALPDFRGRAPVHQGGGVATGARSGLTKNLPVPITEATNTTPIKITTANAHGFNDREEVTITGVLGNTAANGDGWKITLIDAKHFTINSKGKAAYTSGGTVGKWPLQVPPPYLGVNFYISLDNRPLDDPYVGEIRMFAGDYTPVRQRESGQTRKDDWALCEGQLVSLSQNTALFSLLGTNYGGDGKSTFALPDLRGAMPVGVKPGADPKNESVRSFGKLPAVKRGGKGAGVAVQKGAVQVAYLPVSFIIAMKGIFPPRADPQ